MLDATCCLPLSGIILLAAHTRAPCTLRPLKTLNLVYPCAILGLVWLQNVLLWGASSAFFLSPQHLP
jgi:hypothetical protein